MATLISSSDIDLTRALAALSAGECVGLPTETVYGLAADASNARAVAKIFALKGRPADHPLIVHLAHADDAIGWAAHWSEAAQRLAQSFWPGPMTLIVRRAPHVLDAVTGGQETVGLRVPSHPIAHAVLSAFRGGDPIARGLAAPSANKFGHVSPTTAAHVVSEFIDEPLLVIDGGECEVGVESTIIDVSGKSPRVLRPGRVRTSELEAALGRALAANEHHGSKPRVSGSLDSHYAPRKKTLMLSGDALEIFLAAARDAGKRVGLIHHTTHAAAQKAKRHIALDGQASARYEHDIYRSLRDLDDDQKIDLIVVESPSTLPDWDAVNDRLRRATHVGNG